jgi:hypothetical protein
MEIKEALWEKHKMDVFFTECKTCSTYFPDKQGLLIFDGLAITKSYASPRITGYEIKVSRSDFLQDSKWHLYLQYCNEFYFVVPYGLINKNELPENVGLMYYNPEKESLLTKKKAMYRGIEEPIGIYKYILFSRLENDRLPFYENRAEYARDYIKDKDEKRRLGNMFGTKLTEDLVAAQSELDSLRSRTNDLELLKEIQEIIRKHKINFYGRTSLLEELDKALTKKYPEEFDFVKNNLNYALNIIDQMKIRYQKPENDEPGTASSQQEVVA